MVKIIIFLVLLTVGYVAGTQAEKRHYRSIVQRESALLNLPAVTLKSVDIPDHKIRSAQMVYGSAVISVDYFKQIVASLRKLVGGNLTSYESLMDRARREALLRMKEMAVGATVIVNVRVETATIDGQRGDSGTVGCLEAMAYGTAIFAED
ncbi:YbjQ family protein [Desulfosarcina sp. OttesenSCG-928-G10]|nr:YbjQ family protein [Desulfosarcina sp. OttesenSCG-928-G10]MDL2321258.1 YbjQ family protein [Desulfosarcina sp. OttesenSCG-928-B08]